MSSEHSPATLPPQHQDRQPGLESAMQPAPASFAEHYVGSGRLRGEIALITGGDSGIGRATAIAFAKEGADLVLVYRDAKHEAEDAEATCQAIAAVGRRALALAGDVGDEAFCQSVIRQTMSEFGRLDVLVNNAAEQHPQASLADIDAEQLERTFRSNVFALFHLTRAALPHLLPGARIINTASVTAYQGSPHLLDYAASKGAVVAFTRSLALQLVARGIRVNAVAPGPIWTALIPSTSPADEVAHFGANTPLQRPGQPDEVAPSFVFLASDAASYMTGQVLHPNGGRIVNG